MSAHRQTHRSFGNHTHIHSSLNYRNHQQRHQRSYNQRNQQQGYNQHNAPRRPDYQPSRRHDHNVHNNPHANFWSSAESEYSPVIPSISPYSLFPYSEQIDDVYVATLPIEFNRISGETFHYINYWTRRLIDRERNLRIEFRALYDRDPEDDLLKYLKIRTHHVVDKDEIDTEVAEVESDICSICLSVYEHEENIGALQCGHEYHTDCIKQWLLRKNDCPMCRASILPSQEQRCACLM